MRLYQAAGDAQAEAAVAAAGGAGLVGTVEGLEDVR
jgi:hypothetical protein